MIKDILLEVFGPEKPRDWDIITAVRAADTVEHVMHQPGGRSAVQYALHAAYFDKNKAILARDRIFSEV